VRAPESPLRGELAVADTKFHHRIPIVGRPFLQRNEARLQRDQTQQELARVGAERDEAWRQRDKAWRERDGALRERDRALQERDETWRERDEAWRQRDEAWRERNGALREREEALDNLARYQRTPPNYAVDLITGHCAAGWVFSDGHPITRVIAKRDNQIVATTSSFELRPDVAAAYPNSRHASRSGFRLFFDPSDRPSTISIFTEQGDEETLIGEGMAVDPHTLEVQIDKSYSNKKTSYPSALDKSARIIYGDDKEVNIDMVCDVLKFSDIGSVHQISDYLNYMTSCWSHFTFVARFFPKLNRKITQSQNDVKDFFCKGNSAIEMMSIAHHLYVLKSYGVKGELVEFGCFKGFSSSMLSYACSLLGITLHIYDSFEGLPQSESSYYKQGDFSGSIEEVKENIERFGAINTVVFHKGFFADSLKAQMPPPLIICWMDVDLAVSARDALEAAKTLLSPVGAIFSHECEPSNFAGVTPCSSGEGPDDVVPAILDYYREQSVTPNGLFVAGSTGAFWRSEEGIPVLPTKDLKRVLEFVSGG